MAQQALQQQVADTEIKAEFYTPTIVRVTKTPIGRNYTPKNLVVTAKPQDVTVSRKGNSMSSSSLTVKMDARTGALTFTTANG